MSHLSLRCIVCGGAALEPVLELAEVPVSCGFLMTSAAAAAAVPRGRIALVACWTCGHVQNAAFEPAKVEYRYGYENSLDFSPRFRAYAAKMARRLANTYELRGKKVVEIGCGDGEFLQRLCEIGGIQGTGYDPSRADAPAVQVGDGTFRIFGSYFNGTAKEKADLICSRQVLEHVPEPVALLCRMREVLAPAGGACVCEVPNALFIVEASSFWDLIYEHVSYFSPASLAHAMRKAELAIQAWQIGFGGQFLVMEAVIRGAHAAIPPLLAPRRSSLVEFAARYARTISLWRRRLDALSAAARRVVLWGGGSKGTMFLNLVGARADRDIEYVVDVNPRKEGHFVPGAGQRIVPPAFLAGYRPEVVLVMNELYMAEIAATLQAMTLEPELVLVKMAGGGHDPETSSHPLETMHCRRPTSICRKQLL